MTNKDDCLKMVAEEVKEVRDKYQPNLTQEALGKKIGKSTQAISNIENAKYFPSLDTLVDISKATKTNLVIAFKTDEQLKAEKELNELIEKKRG